MILRKSCLQNHQKPFSKTTFWDVGKTSPENLIKPVENEDSIAYFSEMVLKSIKKALPREGFRNVFRERRKTL